MGSFGIQYGVTPNKILELIGEGPPKAQDERWVQETMRFHPYQMTLQGKVATANLCTLAALMLGWMLLASSWEDSVVLQIGVIIFNIVTFPVGSILMTLFLPGPEGVFVPLVFYSTAFIANAYLWGWLWSLRRDFVAVRKGTQPQIPPYQN